MQAVICGSGIAGLTLAWWLQRDGWDVVLAERAPELHGAGHMIDFFGPGYDAADRMGLLPEIRKASYSVDAVLYHAPDGRPTGAIPFSIFSRMYKGRVVSLPRGDLEQILYDAVGGAADLRFSTGVASVTAAADHVDVELTDGNTIRADLLIGADGIHSHVRGLVFGPEQRFLRDLGYHVAAYVFLDPAMAQKLGDTFHMVEAPGIQAGAYGLGGGRVAAMLAHRADGPLPADPRAELTRLYGGLGWFVPRILEHCPASEELYYDRMAQIEMPAWSQNRVALLGDACQAVSLLAGQGASLAMGGAHVLAEELRRADDIPTALQRYEARMRTAVLKKQKAGRNTADWFVPATRPKIMLRSLLLRLVSSPGFAWIMHPLLATPGRNVVTSGPDPE